MCLYTCTKIWQWWNQSAAITQHIISNIASIGLEISNIVISINLGYRTVFPSGSASATISLKALKHAIAKSCFESETSYKLRVKSVLAAQFDLAAVVPEMLETVAVEHIDWKPIGTTFLVISEMTKTRPPPKMPQELVDTG